MGRLTERKGDYCFMSCGDAKEKYGDDCPFHNNCYERKIHDKLAHYEDLEEAGKLITIEPVKGYEEQYGVDQFGQVYSFKGSKVIRRKPTLNKSGYCYVNLKDNGRIKNARVHRLVAEAFISNPNDLPYVNHIDGDKTNNHVSNLEWCTASENSRHALSKGMLKPPTNNVDGVYKNGKNKYVVIKNLRSDEVFIFTNLRNACEYICRGHDFIWSHTSKDIWHFTEDCYDVHVFLTKEEALAKLKELKGE